MFILCSRVLIGNIRLFKPLKRNIVLIVIMPLICVVTMVFEVLYKSILHCSVHRITASLFSPSAALLPFRYTRSPSYYMASSASWQDEPNRALWLATRTGKMEPSCPLGTTRCIPLAKFHQKPYNKSFIDQVCSVKMAGYWSRSFFASLWTST